MKVAVSAGVVAAAVAMWSCGGASPAEPSAGSAAQVPAAAAGGEDEVVDLTDSGADVTASTHISLIRWTLRDACADNRGIRFRFFDVTNGGRTKQLKLRSGATATWGVLCRTRAKVCVGGTQDPPGSTEFGVGPNGAGRQTSAACKACLNGKRYRSDFTCSRRALGDELGEVVDGDEFGLEE
jgi:hypothetical protein